MVTPAEVEKTVCVCVCVCVVNNSVIFPQGFMTEAEKTKHTFLSLVSAGFLFPSVSCLRLKSHHDPIEQTLVKYL